MEIKTLCLLMILSLGVQLPKAEVLLRQKRDWIIDTLTIDEGYNGTFPHYLGKIDIDSNISVLAITGPGINEEPRELLEINQKSGRAFQLGPVDYEKYQLLKLTIKGRSKMNQPVIYVGVNFEIIDANDNPPIFDQTAYETTIKESTLQGTTLINVTATDGDRTEEFKKFNFSIDSVSPKPDDLEFFIVKLSNSDHGKISFKGCLDRKKAEKYTLIVKATDFGKPKPLSSSTTVTINIEHGNQHRPVITNQTGQENVKEGLQDVLVSRLQVKDEDTIGTKGWKAKYKIHGDKNNSFRIITDPQTNEGLLYVNKPLDFEDESLKNISVSVENEIPYFTCKVTDRNTAGLWKLETDPPRNMYSGASMGSATAGGGTYPITVVVEDVNEPPIFDPLKPVSVHENVKEGHYLATCTARDPDATSTDIRYIKGDDPADFAAVDSKTGNITTSRILDRESPFDEDGVYVITIHAVDSGNPSMTGTATLSIYIIDENDNAPFLNESTFYMCQSDKPSRVKVTAVDLDEYPFGGPFWFELVGDANNIWRVDPGQGYSVNLVNDKKVYSGHHELQLEVSDYQGKKALHNVTVTVCECADPTRPDCRQLKATGSIVGARALGIMFLGIILLIGLLLLTFLITCKPEKLILPDDDTVQHLMTSNTEEPGNDCQVPFLPLNHCVGLQRNECGVVTQSMIPVSALKVCSELPSAVEIRPPTNKPQTSSNTVWMEDAHQTILLTVVMTALNTLEVPGKELGDYEPIKYADEGDMEHNFELDTISNPEAPFDSDLELDSTFLPLALICSPDMFPKSRDA
ncbi:cadherin-like protein 26 isoform X1 [Fundulus heteroclitus]|uniref:cadherin-like protein 26 isoform X1 n=1 Tax=Fundulus heteroclitus TaxID=8078 RepID=UPI00165AE819|nr:cadherin-like protein 26 isoform X1 [Fundulus heteroclitus]